MRALSLRAAQNCENALKPRCHCRCGGKLHGAKRLGDAAPGRDQFEQLPADDPHHLPTPAEIAHARAATREHYKAKRRKKRELSKRLREATHDVNRWRAWSGPEAPLPQSLTNRLASLEAELAQL